MVFMLLKELKSYLTVTFGVLLISIETYFFCFPNGFAFEGSSGVSVLINAVFPIISQSTAAFIFNTICLIIGFLFLGRSFAIKTVYSSVLMNVFLFIFEYFKPLKNPLTDMKLMELLYAVLLVGVGTSLLFNEDASSGGMDVVALIIKKYTNIKPGAAVFICCIFIVLFSFAIFGVKTGLCSLFGLLLKTLIIDSVLENMKMKKCLHIFTDHGEEITKYINNILGCGATIVDCKGAYSREDKKLIITIMNYKEVKKVEEYIKKEFPDCFFVIYKSSEVFSRTAQN